MRSLAQRRSWAVGGALLAFVALVMGSLTALQPAELAAPTAELATSAQSLAPTVPPVQVCGNVAPGPTEPPAGARVLTADDPATPNVDEGDHSDLTPNWASPGFGDSNVTWYFEPGLHTLGDDDPATTENEARFIQIAPGSNVNFVGGFDPAIGGAVLDGQGANQYAFTGKGTDVVIQHLEVKGFISAAQEGVINHDYGQRWTIEHSWIHHNGGAAMMGSHQGVIQWNCIDSNGQYGLNACCPGDGPNDAGEMTGLMVVNNEFRNNNTKGEPPEGCGCTGNMKFWETKNSTVADNWIHGNDGPGVWFDGNNAGAIIRGNLIEDNTRQGIFFEQSYNGQILNNTLRRNTWVTGQEFAARGDLFPIGTIYVSEAGFDSRVPAPAGAVDLRIEGNVLTNNWGGIALWENADRFCNSPADTSKMCTLVDPATVNKETCDAETFGLNGENKPEPYYSDCRWNTQHVLIQNNTLTIDPAVIPGYQDNFSNVGGALFSNCGSAPSWSPYKGNAVAERIVFQNDNVWQSNTYEGPWKYNVYAPNRRLTFAEWQSSQQGSDCEMAGGGAFGQDAGSTYDGTTPTTTTTTDAPVTTTSEAPVTTTSEAPVTTTTAPPASELPLVLLKVRNGVRLVCPVPVSPVAGQEITCTFRQ